MSTVASLDTLRIGHQDSGDTSTEDPPILDLNQSLAYDPFAAERQTERSRQQNSLENRMSRVRDAGIQKSNSKRISQRAASRRVSNLGFPTRMSDGVRERKSQRVIDEVGTDHIDTALSSRRDIAWYEILSVGDNDERDAPPAYTP